LKGNVAKNDEITATLATFVGEAFTVVEDEAEGFARVTLTVEFSHRPYDDVVKHPVKLIYEASVIAGEVQHQHRSREEWQ
jgi:hypothetical protein